MVIERLVINNQSDDFAPQFPFVESMVSSPGVPVDQISVIETNLIQLNL